LSLSAYIQREFLSLLLALPESWKLKLSGGVPIQIGNHTLHPDMQLICQLAKLNPDPSNYRPTKARKKFNTAMKIFAKNPLSLPKVETTLIGSADEAIKIRIYNPDPTRDNHPVLVYFHGGGFVLGDIEMTDEVCRYLAHRTPCMVFSVNYRLAPEYPFPIPVEDCFRAYEWIRTHSYRLGANPKAIGVAGDSAGGNLAIAVTRKCLENQVPLPRFQGLIYPVTDFSTEHPSHETFSEGFLLTRKMMRWFKSLYFSKPEDVSNPYASPLLTDSFRGYPPTYLSTAGFDPLVDEGRALVLRLRSDGVKVVHSDFPSLIHGYVTMGSLIPVALDAVEDFIRFLKTEYNS